MRPTDDQLGRIVRRCVQAVMEELDEPPEDYNFYGMIHHKGVDVRIGDTVHGNKVEEVCPKEGNTQMLRLRGPKPFSIISLDGV